MSPCPAATGRQKGLDMHTGFTTASSKDQLPVAQGLPSTIQQATPLRKYRPSGEAKCRVAQSVNLNLSTRPKLDLPRVSHLGRHAIRPVFSSKGLPLFARERNHICRHHQDR